MSDLEQQLTGVLADVSEMAPAVSGLADGARRRHRVRRQRRLALGAGAIAVVVGAGAVLVGGLGGTDRANDPVDQQHLTPRPEGGWQDVVDSGLHFSVPADWTRRTCPDADAGASAIWAAPGGDPCADGMGALLGGPQHVDLSSTVGAVERIHDGDRTYHRGVVGVGQLYLGAADADRDVVRRILASAGVEGQPAVVADQWVSFERKGISYEIPTWWGVGESGDRSGYSVCLLPEDSPQLDGVVGDAAHYVLSDGSEPGAVIRVVAPTQAVAEMVMDTLVVRVGSAGSEDCGPEDFALGLLPGESTPGAGETGRVDRAPARPADR